jgi:RNA polymerase sigma-70 factor, ECF subfamily
MIMEGAVSMLTSAELVWLIAAVAKGDKAAFARLYQATCATLYGAVLRITGRTDLAAQTLTESYLAIWSSAGRFDPRADRPVSWMVANARERAIDRVRGQSAHFAEDAPEAIETAEGFVPPAPQDPSPELQRLLACMGRIDEERRRLLLTAYYGGCSRDRLAAEFEKSVGTIKGWLRGALLDIRDCLEP